MRTLWQVMTQKKVVQEELIYNPLGLKINARVDLNVMDHRGKIYFLREIVEHDRLVDGQSHKFVDYLLKSPNDELVNLRAFPFESTMLRKQNCELLLLTKFDEMADSEDVESALNDPEDFKITLDSGEVEHFARITDGVGPQKVTTKRLKDLDANGRIDKNEVIDGKVLVWDFYREKSDENDGFEFLYADKDEKTGWQVLWRGFKILNSQVFCH